MAPALRETAAVAMRVVQSETLAVLSPKVPWGATSACQDGEIKLAHANARRDGRHLTPAQTAGEKGRCTQDRLKHRRRFLAQP